MNASIQLLTRLWSRAEIRLASAGAAGLLAVYLGFLGVSVAAADTFIKHAGYYIIFASFGLFLHALWRWWRWRPSAGGEVMTRRQTWVVVLAIAGFSALALNAEPFVSKILNDEFVLQSTAFNMHFFRDVAMMVRGYDIQGVFLSTDSYLDKRPYFYPFLVSLAHDLTGYRPLNAYLVNAVLMPVSLGLTFVVGRLLAGWRGGLLALVLLGTLPLLGQNATGSGMELLNIVMILGTLILAAEYLRAPADESLAALGLAAVLLAQARYESALYVAPIGIVTLAGWLRAGRIIVPWQLLLVPLLLVPVALQNKVLSNSPLMWELTEKATSRFSLDYFAGNVNGAWVFLTSPNPMLGNSRLLSVVGLIALAWGGWRLIRGLPKWRTAAPAALAFAAFSLTIAANTVVVFCYYWSSFMDPMASRFALPMHVAMTFCVVLLMATLDRWWPATKLLIAAGLVFLLGVTTSRYAIHGYSHVGIDEIEWERRFVNALPPGNRIIIANKTTLYWLLDKTPSILIGRARLVPDRLAYQLQAHDFTEILVLQGARPTSVDGNFEIVPADRLPPGFRVELMAEKRFGTKLARISRLIAVDVPPASPADGKAPPPADNQRRSATTPPAPAS